MIKYLRILRTEPHLEFAGVDYGGPLHVLREVGANLVINKPAYTVWKSRGEVGTDPARVMIGTRFMDKEGHTWVTLFYEQETGRAWRQARANAFARAAVEVADLPKWGIPYAV